MSSKRLLHAALLSSVAFLAIPSAHATVIVLGSNSTSAQTLANDDSLTVNSGVTLSPSKVAVTWNGGSASPGTTVDNKGTITTSKRAIDSGTFSTGSLSVTNETGAKIISTGADAFRVNTNITTGTLLLTNDGLIAAQGTGGNNGQAIDFDNIASGTAVVHIINQSNGVLSAADADAVRPGNASLIDNYGQITSAYVAATETGNSSSNDAVDFQDNNTGTVDNYSTGSITGARHGITGKNAIVVNNWGAITGSDGSGINLDTSSASLTYVTNYSTGTIVGNAVSGDGDGVDVDGLLSLENYGQIKGLGHYSTELSEGVTIGGGTIDNYSTGLIEGVDRAITVDDSNKNDAFGATTIYNEGTIKGDSGDAIKLTDCGSGADGIAQRCFSNTLTNKGTIIGNVALGNGDDTLNLGHGSSITGTVDGQGGNDAVHLADAGTVSNLVNFETLSADSGSSTLTGAQTYSSGASVQNTATLGLDGATLNANVGIASGGTLAVGGAGGTVNGDVTNNGAVQVTGAPATFNGTFTNNGTFSSDPTTLHFSTFENGADGVVKAAPGDVYQVTGDFLNHSTQNLAWDTSGAILEFMGGTNHTLGVNGADLGPVPAGYYSNFAWGELKIDSGDTLTLTGLSDSVFYTIAILGADIAGNAITNITGDFDIYYDATNAANAYLGGLTYDLEGGGKLIAAATPEPATLLLAAPALLLMRRRKRAGISISGS